jgi:hypothetical protein
MCADVLFLYPSCPFQTAANNDRDMSSKKVSAHLSIEGNAIKSVSPHLSVRRNVKPFSKLHSCLMDGNDHPCACSLRIGSGECFPRDAEMTTDRRITFQHDSCKKLVQLTNMIFPMSSDLDAMK